jgi:hypothetical protein
MNFADLTQEEFFAALDRLGERDVRKLVQARAFDGREAVWAEAWVRGERPVKVERVAREERTIHDEPYARLALAS